MRIAIRKWGNSLALRIPKSLADDAIIVLGSEVELRVERGRLVATPLGRTETLAELVAQITEQNRHGEAFVDTPRGAEEW